MAAATHHIDLPGRRFPRRLLQRGYRSVDVDAFLTRVDVGEFAIEEARAVRFRGVLGGYCFRDVDEYLAAIESGKGHGAQGAGASYAMPVLVLRNSRLYFKYGLWIYLLLAAAVFVAVAAMDDPLGRVVLPALTLPLLAVFAIPLWLAGRLAEVVHVDGQGLHGVSRRGQRFSLAWADVVVVRSYPSGGGVLAVEGGGDVWRIDLVPRRWRDRVVLRAAMVRDTQYGPVAVVGMSDFPELVQQVSRHTAHARTETAPWWRNA